MRQSKGHNWAYAIVRHKPALLQRAQYGVHHTVREGGCAASQLFARDDGETGADMGPIDYSAGGIAVR